MIFDTHSHCYWDMLEPRIDAIVENMQQANVSHAVQIGCDIQTTKSAITLARRFPGIFMLLLDIILKILKMTYSIMRKCKNSRSSFLKIEMLLSLLVKLDSTIII